MFSTSLLRFSVLVRHASSQPAFHGTTLRQLVVHSDGSTFHIRTTSPRPLLILTKDVRNHPIWTSGGPLLDDSSGELKKFAERYEDAEEDGDVVDFGALSTFGDGSAGLDGLPFAALSFESSLPKPKAPPPVKEAAAPVAKKKKGGA
ncbi:hypothetical protein BJ742DRAFT_791135 [Cladochytrium replicatum]|nr:hypothetical protein BJ742DRAFT_791135 [Cladochytrium replicatum]